MTGDVFECCDDYVLTCVLGYANVTPVGVSGTDIDNTGNPSTDGSAGTDGTPTGTTEGGGGAGDESDSTGTSAAESVVLEDCPTELQSDATTVSLGIRCVKQFSNLFFNC